MSIISVPIEYLRYPLPEFHYGACVLAGGALRDSLRNEPYKDLDIFGPDTGAFEDFKKANLQDYKLIYTSKWAETYVKEGTPASIQLVFRPYNSAYQLFSEFPFSINHFIYGGTSHFVTTEVAMLDTFQQKSRLLNFSKADALDTLARLARYEKRGYTAIPGTQDYILKQIGELSDYELKEQTLRPGQRHY